RARVAAEGGLSVQVLGGGRVPDELLLVLVDPLVDLAAVPWALGQHHRVGAALLAGLHDDGGGALEVVGHGLEARRGLVGERRRLALAGRGRALGPDRFGRGRRDGWRGHVAFYALLRFVPVV